MKIYRNKYTVELQEAIYREGQEFEHYFTMGVAQARYWNHSTGKTYSEPLYWHLTLKKNNFGGKEIWEIAQMRIWQSDGVFGLDVDLESVKQLIKILQEKSSSKKRGDK
jgi:hypothetical protein